MGTNCVIGLLTALWSICPEAATAAASTDNYPTKPLRWVVPYAPGGGSDIVARAIAVKLTEAWGQPVIICFRRFKFDQFRRVVPICD